MKKFALLALTLSAMLTFTACGSNEAAAETETTVEATTEAAEATETTEAAEPTVEVISETEKVAKYVDEEGTNVATLTLAEGKPVSIAFDYIQEDGSSKHEAATNGEYVMAGDGLNWAEQADALAAFLAENDFDVTKVTLTDEDGHTDAVTGVSIKVPGLVKAAEAVLAE